MSLYPYICNALVCVEISFWTWYPRKWCCWLKHTKTSQYWTQLTPIADSRKWSRGRTKYFFISFRKLFSWCHLLPLPSTCNHVTNKSQTKKKQFKFAEHLNQFNQFQRSDGGISAANTSICMEQVARAYGDLLCIRLCGGAPAVTCMKWSIQAWKEDTGQWARTVTAAKWTQQRFIPRNVTGMIWAFPEKQNSECY